MTRFRLLIEYDGAPFVGWQRQDNMLSVQQALEDAVFAFCGERPASVAAGRTDAGVHALGQVVHLDIAKDCAPETLRDAVNFYLKPLPVAVLAAEIASPDFHARFQAIGRRYLYRIVNRRPPLVLERGRAWWVSRALDAAAMQDAAQLLVGHHDFTSFRSSICQAASPLKTLDRLEVDREGEEIRIHAASRSFLHHQVRNMVGTLKLVGAGKWRVAHVAEALAARDRRAGGPTAPPDGLYLVEVIYAPPAPQ
jgi:tRNA pseudouridine38-40 synthase